MINVTCPNCGSTLEINENKIGHVIQCPLCGNSFPAQVSIGQAIPKQNAFPMPPAPLPSAVSSAVLPASKDNLGIGIKLLVYLVMLLPGVNLLALLICHILFVAIWRNSKNKAIQLLMHSWIGFIVCTILMLLLFFGVRAFNMHYPEVFHEMTPEQVEKGCISQLQMLFNLTEEAGQSSQENEQDNSMYIYAGATVKKLQLAHVGKCQYKGRVFFELDEKEYSRPVLVQYKRDSFLAEPVFSFDLTHGSYADTPEELYEDMVIAYRAWLQRRNKGLEGWNIVEMNILTQKHPVYVLRLSCERIGNAGKKHSSEMSAELTFANLTMGRYYPHLKFYDIDHEILHSYFIYNSLGRQFKDGITITECRLKKCTKNVDLFSVKFSDDTFYTAHVTLGDDFTFNIQKLEKAAESQIK